MSRRWRIAVAVSLALLNAGCTQVTPGTAVPARNQIPRPLTGSGIAQVILDAAAVSKIFDRTLTPNPEAQQHVGGSEELLSPMGPASPTDCLGPTEVLDKSSYGSATVRDVARWTVVLRSGRKRVVSLVEGVVALPSAGDADALFAKFSDQWKRCDGTTVSSSSDTTKWLDTVSRVRVANSVLVANIADQTSPINLPEISFSLPGAHAIGVRGNCLVEVKTGYIDTSMAGDPGGPTVDIAHAMMDRVTALG
jgi:hypothetical protein